MQLYVSKHKVIVKYYHPAYELSKITAHKRKVTIDNIIVEEHHRTLLIYNTDVNVTKKQLTNTDPIHIHTHKDAHTYCNMKCFTVHSVSLPVYF